MLSKASYTAHMRGSEGLRTGLSAKLLNFMLTNSEGTLLNQQRRRKERKGITRGGPPVAATVTF